MSDFLIHHIIVDGVTHHARKAGGNFWTLVRLPLGKRFVYEGDFWEVISVWNSRLNRVEAFKC